MNAFQLGEVFAEREFKGRDLSGELTHVILRVGKPQTEESGAWYCPFQIIGIGNQEVEIGFGTDSCDALLTALYMAPKLIMHFARQDQKKLLG